MTDQRSPKAGLGLSGRVELHQKLIMTPRIMRHVSDEEDEKRLFLPPKKGKSKR